MPVFPRIPGRYVVRHRRLAVVLLASLGLGPSGPPNRVAPAMEADESLLVTASHMSTNSAVAPSTEPTLAGMEATMRRSLTRYTLPSLYRARCAAAGQPDRAIQFFAALVAAQPTNTQARLQLACAYVDKIPTCTGLTAMLQRGSLAGKSLEQLDRVLAAHPDSWVARYTRGMNHLHWPRAFRHSHDAVEDFIYCLKLQGGDPTAGSRSYYVRPYIALGDAWIKTGEPRRGRQAWRDGWKQYPESRALQQRLAIKSDGALLEYVEAQRNLDKPVDTDLSFLDPEL